MTGHRAALSALLSRALVAFITEFDNEFEREMPHRTSRYGSALSSSDAPWLVSMALWLHVMQFVPETGITVSELAHRTGSSRESLRSLLTRLSKWWGYVVICPRGERHAPDSMVRQSEYGKLACAIWSTLPAAIEQRWRDRFGTSEIARLRSALSALDGEPGGNLPCALPILGYGMFSKVPGSNSTAPAVCCEPSRLALPVLLSKVLLGFAVEFDAESEVSMAISADLLRLLGDDRVRVRDLPSRSGVSKEAIAIALSYLVRNDFAVVRT